MVWFDDRCDAWMWYVSWLDDGWVERCGTLIGSTMGGIEGCGKWFGSTMGLMGERG